MKRRSASLKHPRTYNDLLNTSFRRLQLLHLPKLREKAIVEKGIRGVEGECMAGREFTRTRGLREQLEGFLQVEELERLRFASLVKRF
jgi:hypothetical protein